jgi:hypothetical protein
MGILRSKGMPKYTLFTAEKNMHIFARAGLNFVRRIVGHLGV